MKYSTVKRCRNVEIKAGILYCKYFPGLFIANIMSHRDKLKRKYAAKCGAYASESGWSVKKGYVRKITETIRLPNLWEGHRFLKTNQKFMAVRIRREIEKNCHPPGLYPNKKKPAQ